MVHIGRNILDDWEDNIESYEKLLELIDDEGEDYYEFLETPMRELRMRDCLPIIKVVEVLRKCFFHSGYILAIEFARRWPKYEIVNGCQEDFTTEGYMVIDNYYMEGSE